MQQIVVLHGLLIQLYTGTGPGSEIVELGVKRVHMIPYYLVFLKTWTEHYGSRSFLKPS